MSKCCDTQRKAMLAELRELKVKNLLLEAEADAFKGLFEHLYDLYRQGKQNAPDVLESMRNWFKRFRCV